LRFFLLLSFAFAAHAQGFDHAHKAWDALLKKHVVPIAGGKASQVRYTGMAQERPALKAYLQELSNVDDTQFNRWTKPQQMAFLINAYNAYAVEKILTRYPNIKMSLDGIEHETLRKHYKDPRVHYAVNCASVGCPMLREEAYVAVRLEEQLEAQARRFLSDRSRNRARDAKLEVSKIFDWYKEDFEPRERYFAKYAKFLSDDPAQQQLVAEGKARLSFLDYDWSLNDSRSSSLR
jgi:hypothetical protein